MPRKKPFSVKQKKKQLQDKRSRKRTNSPSSNVTRRGLTPRPQGVAAVRVSSDDIESFSDSEPRELPFRLNHGNPQRRAYDPNRYRLQLGKESAAEIAQRKRQAMQPYKMLPESALEVDTSDIYKPGSVLDMPKRPPWDYTMSRAKVEQQEADMFEEYLAKIYKEYSPEDLSYFEMNLETWRQLWRVLEMSDIILLITDIRHPALHFPPALYDYVTKELKKYLILVLNKIDLAPPSLVVAWRSFFKEKFPDLQIVCFTSFPKEVSDIERDPGKVLQRKRRRGAFTAVGPLQLYKACQDVCDEKVDLSAWREKIEAEIRGEESLATQIIENQMSDSEQVERQHEFCEDGVLTIGCVGYPNVGKSSLMNGLCGRKVVSASRTPGHTKHFQTIFLTPVVKLCDSPGLVFPSLVNKQLQILSGIFPISQVREPYTAVGYLAERIPLVKILKITHPDADDSPASSSKTEWSAYDICDAWAEKRGFFTAKASRRDVYRAANNILRLAVEGRLCMCIRPTEYTSNKTYWEGHSETREIATMQEQHRQIQIEGGQSEPSSSAENSDADIESEEETEDSESSSPHGLNSNNPFELLATA